MRTTVFDWLGHEWIALSTEGQPGLRIAEQTRDIFQSLDAELRARDVSLDNTIRTRLWARDREARNVGSRVRVAILSGAARSASSSFIAPMYFESEADVAVELWAVRPSRPGAEKKLVEYEPPIVPLRYLVYDGIVALSGMTSVLPTLEEQVAEVLGSIVSALSHAGVGWENVVQLSGILHRSQRIDDLRAQLIRRLPALRSYVEYDTADGYSTEGKLIEIEVTAVQPA